jgi:hypothetical protein
MVVDNSNDHRNMFAQISSYICIPFKARYIYSSDYSLGRAGRAAISKGAEVYIRWMTRTELI